jgi:uncharacterized membrane protein YfcA
MFYLILILVGAFSGALAGLLGLGGGIIVVPALAAVFAKYHLIPPQHIMQMAIGTSLSTIIITFSASLIAHIKHQAVRWDMVRIVLPGLVLGVIAGALLAHDLPSNFLRIFFCLFLFVIAVRLFLSKNQPEPLPLPARWIMWGTPCIIGILSSVLGIGGGVLLIPFLLRCQLNMRQATGTSVAAGMGIALTATASFMLLGRAAVDLPWSTGYIYWPAFLGVALASMLFAPLGTMLAYRLPAVFLKYFLAVFLLFVAIFMSIPH